MRSVGRYTILSQLGRGGMAIVHLARHDASGGLVALKELVGLLVLDDDATERLLRSATLLDGLRHPAVVEVHEVFEEEGIPYLAMEYVERGSLRPLLGVLTPEQFAGVFEDVLAGLAHLSEHGIVHRDLKPENLLVSAGGKVKITDFALAKAAAEVTQATITPTGWALGTLSYMAPEQATGRPVDGRADLYALGCIAYEVLVGHVPFYDRDQPMSMLYRRVNEDVPAPVSLAPFVPRALSDWVAGLLARDPADRPESARAAWRELEVIVGKLAGPRWREDATLPLSAETVETVEPPADACPACGGSNPPDVDFCRHCGKYLRWDDTDRSPRFRPRAREATPPPAPAPAAAAPRPMPSVEPPAPRETWPPLPAVDEPRLVRRTPHLDLSLPPPLAPGDLFDVVVYADEGPARAGEEVEDILVKAPRAQTAVELDVWLVATHHFVIADAPVRRVALELDEPASTRATFRVAVVAAPADGEEPLITASFSCNGRPSGRVTRAVAIGSGAPAPASDPTDLPALEVDLTTVHPDLTIEIAAPEKDGRRFEVRVDTALLDLERRTETWFLPVAAAEMVTTAMDRFFDRDATPRARMSSLRGAGLEFFDAAPQLFKDVYWRLADLGRRPRNLYIVSDERSIPWELMIPSRRTPEGTEEHDPLGVQMAIGRWHRQTGVSPRQRVPLVNSVVVAPQYRSSARLEHAAAEAEFVCRNFAGSRVDPASFDNLDEELERAGADLLHFVCHGEADERDQVLLLEEPDRLYARQLRAMPGLKKACRERKPLVFLNACELGRQGHGLAAASSFAKSFIDVDATGVIGTLWSVDDRTAHAVAIAFYEQLLSEPGTPFAEVLRRIRARGYEAPGEDSWAAYCFYGDPVARIG